MNNDEASNHKKEDEASKNYKDPTGKNEEVGTPKNSGYAEKQPKK